MLEAVSLRTRYAVGNWTRWATSPWRQWTISPSVATTIFGCSFGIEGWHHIRRTLAEFDANPSLAARDSTLWRYLSGFAPTSVSILAGVEDEEPLPLFEYPWGTFSGTYMPLPKDAQTSRFCGPSSDAFILEEFARTLTLYATLKVSGYRPTAYPNSFIGGTWLLAADGERRFVVMQGNHRMAILAHLGVPQLAVRTGALAHPAVRERDIVRWEHVRSGRCSERHARQVFEYFFRNAGWQIGRSLGYGG